MILPDHEITKVVGAGVVGIKPFNRDQVQPASYDMRLGTAFRIYPREQTRPIDVKSPERRTQIIQLDEGEAFRIEPHEFMLASTVEFVRLPSEIVGRIEGKSSLARLGLFVHVTAGFIDPGFHGHPTLELFNGNHFAIKLYCGMPICQMSFERMHSAAEKPYGFGAKGSKYSNQEAIPVESMYYKNFILDD